MKAKTLLYGGRILTQADGLAVDSMAVNRGLIVAVGNSLQHDPDLKNYYRIDLKKRTVVPGFVDAHTHFHYFARSLGMVDLVGLDSIEKCLARIKKFAAGLPRRGWIVGGGYSPDRFKKRLEPDRRMLDRICGGRPAFLFSKDQHTAWVNSRALELAGVTAKTPDPDGGHIDRDLRGEPTGVLRETAYRLVYTRIPAVSETSLRRLYRQALDIAYRRGVTGVHSVDGPAGFTFFSKLAETGSLGLRINYYFPAEVLPELHRNRIRYGAGDDFLRVAGVKVFTDGSLGSQSALCFNKYLGSAANYGIETTPVKEIARIIKSAARLGLPCAIHAIGDRAVANVLDAIEQTSPLKSGARHRIEHLQLVRRKDLARLKRLRVVASMQPSHCPSDIKLLRRYWGKRGANAFIFRTLIDRGIDLAFGSDAPIEPLDPIAGIAAAVRRARPQSRDTFYPEQRITAAEALYRFTVGPAVAVGQEHCRGYLLPGYPADFAVLSHDITQLPPARIGGTGVLATVLDGKVKYAHHSLVL
ncbi:MAG: amidohydrolase [Candidatus Zixiibacteriota bacterium]|nr:MAG: amidohydrolase [candidate division Zixibacteria bacterium]